MRRWRPASRRPGSATATSRSAAAAGASGSRSVIISEPDELEPGERRWHEEGNGLDRLPEAEPPGRE